MNRSSEIKKDKIVNIKPEDKTIKELLVSGTQFYIPRFQREYSWEKKNYKEFLDDMLKCLKVVDGKLCTEQYFLGTMLFVGDCNVEKHSKMDVVDGQQRLTTITILFSALSDRFLSIKEDVLSSQIFRYIMTQDDNGDEIRVLQSKTHYPYFAFYIQDRTKKHKEKPNTEEETCIKDSYEYIYECLSEIKLKEALKNNNSNDQVDYIEHLDYVEILKLYEIKF